MTDNALALLQGQQLAIPTSIASIMQQQQGDDLQTGVGASYAVVSIKGKVFSIKYGGHSTPVLINMNGQNYAAPYFDVVIPKARPELSKTYYKNGYNDGDDAPPTCWSEDGINPLAPLESRPLSPMQNNQHCTDCRLCPMNVFGSKTTDDGRKAKACADTRKMVVLPMVPGPNGQEVMDPDNVKYGGPMLLRVPAASLKAFAEYGAKLQGMGLAYFGVVTRLEFDPTQAYPKFVLKALRTLTEWEAQEMVRVRDSAQTHQILEGSHAAAPASSAPALPAPVQAQPAPVLPAPVQAAPQPLPAPPPVQEPAEPIQPVLEVLNGRTRAEWSAAGWHNDQQLVDAGHARWVTPAPSLPAPPPTNALPAPPPISGAAVPAAQPGTVAVSESLLGKVDSLLNM